MKTFPLPLT